MDRDIHITVDHLDDLEHIVGKLVPKGINPNAVVLYGLLEQGYIFDIAPEILFEGVNDKGEYINPQLIGLSILTHTGRKSSSRAAVNDEDLKYALETLEDVNITEMPTYMGVPVDKFTKRELIKMLAKMHELQVGYDQERINRPY